MNAQKEKKVKYGKKKSDSVINNDAGITNNAEFSTCIDEEIRNKAHEIYNYRLDFGINGTAEEDWHDAERCLNNNRHSNI